MLSVHTMQFLLQADPLANDLLQLFGGAKHELPLLLIELFFIVKLLTFLLIADLPR